MPDRKPTLARAADRYACYQAAVQAPDNEVAFFERVYRREFGRRPTLLREDFCGTGLVSCAWVRGGRHRRAIGIDLDPEPLEWGRRHNIVALPAEARRRIELNEGDAREVTGPKADVVAALNFSFLVFDTRDALRGYFEAARANLAPRGVLAMDLLGGWETMQEDRRDRRRIRGAAAEGDGVPATPAFTYVWEQERFDPITHRCRFHIHFRYDDGSERRRAFTYDWRLWSVPEVRELLREAGFRRADVYWEGTDRATGKGNGVWTRREKAASDPSWIACIVGIK